MVERKEENKIMKNKETKQKTKTSFTFIPKLTIVLTIILMTMIAFWGIYVPMQNRMEDRVKSYDLAMDLEGARVIQFTPSKGTKTLVKDQEGKEVEDTSNLTDEQITEKGYTKETVPLNEESVFSAENYQLTKKVMEDRLRYLGVSSYIINLDEPSGQITVEVPENDATDDIGNDLVTVGKFEIIDKDTQEVLMNNSDIQEAKVMYGSSNTATTQGTSVYLEISFTRDGKKKFENITSTYTNTTANTTNTTENTTGENETNQSENTNSAENNTTESSAAAKQIQMKIDGQSIMTTSFDQVVKTGKMQLTVGTASTDQATIQKYAKNAQNIAVTLNDGKLPIHYDMNKNEYIQSDITTNKIQMAGIAVAVLVGIILIYFMIRFRKNGVLAAISTIGEISLFLLLIRYANVTLSLEGLFGIAIVIGLNLAFIYQLLKKIKQNEQEKEEKTIAKSITETYLSFFAIILPICIVAIAFCFISWTAMSSFGMVMFWGILTLAIYHFLVTGNLLKLNTK